MQILKVAALLFLSFHGCLAVTFTTTTGGETFTLDGDYYLTGNSAIFGSYASITFANSTGSSKSVTLDGAGQRLNYSAGKSTALFGKTGADAITVTLQNIIIDVLVPAAFNALNSGLTVNFGDNVTIFLGKDAALDLSSRAWNFTGNATVDGRGKKLTLNSVGNLALTGASKRLTLTNMLLEANCASGIALNASSAILALNSVNVKMGYNGFEFGAGNLEIINNVTVSGSWVQRLSNSNLYVVGQQSQAGFATYFNEVESPNSFGLVKCLDYRIAVNFFSSTKLQPSPVQLNFLNMYGGNFAYSEGYWMLGYSYASPPEGWNEIGIMYDSNSPFYTWYTYAPFTAYDSVALGSDGAYWFANRYDTLIYRALKTVASDTWNPTSSGLTAHKVAVANQNNVCAWNTSTGIVYQCANPTSATPTTWNVVSGITFPRSLDVGTDGTIWYIDSTGAAYKKAGTTTTLIHNGLGRNLQKISAGGTSSSNYVALLDNPGPVGRVLISQNNSTFYDLGFNGFKNFSLNASGVGLALFDFSVYTPHNANMVTYGKQELFFFNKSASGATNSNIMTYAASPAFYFTTSGTLTVKSGATFMLVDNAALYYASDPSNDGTNTAATKRHLIMEDSSSTLYLQAATITTTATGMALDQGNLLIDGTCAISSSTATAAEFEIANAVNLFIKSNATLDFKGPVIHGY